MKRYVMSAMLCGIVSLQAMGDEVIEITAPRGNYADVMRVQRKLLEDAQQRLEWPSAHPTRGVLDFSHKELQTVSAVHDEKITTIFNIAPSHINCSVLTKMDFSHNHLQEFPLIDIANVCPNVIECDVSHNNISRVLPLFPFVRDTASLLQKLDLSNNQLFFLNIGFLIKQYPNLVLVNVSDNPLKEVQWQNNHTALTTYPFINISRTDLSEQKKDALYKAYIDYAQHQTVATIDLGSNIMGALTAVGATIASTMEYSAHDTDDTIDIFTNIGKSCILGYGAKKFGYTIGLLFQRRALQEIAQKAKEHIITDDAQ